MRRRYEIQEMKTPSGAFDNFRITDTTSDSRVATCWDKASADLVNLALNVLALSDAAPGESAALVPFWLVACTETDAGSRPRVELLTRAPRFCHESEKGAEAEAHRLAALHRHFEFAVLRTIAVAKWNEAEARVKWDELANGGEHAT